jgi:polyisoprenoid-binding protein YceI
MSNKNHIRIRQTLAASLVITSLALAVNWNVDAVNAKIMFSVKGPFGTVDGNFSGLKATIRFSENDLPGSSVSASIEAKTVSTGIGLRNRDLRKKEVWFNADKYPLITFHSRKIEKAGTGYKAIGDLTIKGTTRPVEISFTFNAKGDAGLFKGQFNIKRADYNLGNEGGSVGSIVTIMLEVPVKK